MKEQRQSKLYLFLIVWMLCLWPAVRAGAEITETRAVRSCISADQRFGHSSAVYGDIAVIGAYRDDEKKEDAGAAYVFTLENGVWTQKTRLTSGSAWPHEYLGWSVAVSSDYVMAGAPNRAFGAGAVYVFMENHQKWHFTEMLTADDGERNDSFGCSISISGDYAVIGAYRDNDKGLDAGAAYIFKRTGYEWTQLAKLTPEGISAGDYFGRSAAVYGDNMIISAIHDNSSGGHSGAVYRYRRNGNQWLLQQKLTAGDGGENDVFGFSVSVSETSAAVGAVGDDDRGENAGAVYIYDINDSMWTLSEKIGPPAGSDDVRFGVSASVSGSYIIVGADGDAASGANGGAVYLFQKSGGVWNPKYKSVPDDDGGEDRMGWSSAIYSLEDGEFNAVTGAVGGDDVQSRSGTAYFFSESSEPNIEVIPASLTVYRPQEPGLTPPPGDAPGSEGYPRGLKVPDTVVDYWLTRPRSSVRPPRKPVSGTLPTKVDWSSYDSPVKSQGSCGSCSVFAAAALMENLAGQAGLMQAQDLSEQTVLSCASGITCSGGWYWAVFEYVKENGIPPESCFPYQGGNLSCEGKCDYPDFIAKVNSFTSTPGLWGTDHDVLDLKIALQKGPVCVALAAPHELDFYTGGVFDYEGGPIDWSTNAHAVLLVGYNDDGQYFKVKNSWGSGWGENGYFRIAYNDVEGEVKFGSFACRASGFYLEGERSTFTIANRGMGLLTISSIQSNKSWLSFSPSAPFYLDANQKKTVTVSVDWDIVGDQPQEGAILISSNDPDSPTTAVAVTASISAPSKTLLADVDGTGSITLADAVDRLNILSGISFASAQSDNLSADINGDQRIGFGELIYVLRSTGL